MRAIETNSERCSPYVRHPYAFLALLGDDVECLPREESNEKESLPHVRHPYAYISDQEDVEQMRPDHKVRVFNEPSTDKSISKTELEKELNDLLKLYKPYVAKPDWAKVSEFVPRFLERALRSPATAQSVMGNLRKLRFSLQPGEKVEFNRAPAERIIGALEKLLS